MLKLHCFNVDLTLADKLLIISPNPWSFAGCLPPRKTNELKSPPDYDNPGGL
jgi:hypothetical protein